MQSFLAQSASKAIATFFQVRRSSDRPDPDANFHRPYSIAPRYVYCSIYRILGLSMGGAAGGFVSGATRPSSIWSIEFCSSLPGFV